MISKPSSRTQRGRTGCPTTVHYGRRYRRVKFDDELVEKSRDKGPPTGTNRRILEMMAARITAGESFGDLCPQYGLATGSLARHYEDALLNRYGIEVATTP